MLPAQPNQSLIDGLACLRGLASASNPVGSRELARTLQLEPTRVNRLLKTLAHVGMAERTADGRYAIGPAMHVLSAVGLAHADSTRRARAALEGLRPLGLKVAYGVLFRDQVCYLHFDEPGRPGAAARPFGEPHLYPAARSSIGRVLLAHQPEAAVRELYGGGGSVGRTTGEPAVEPARGVGVALSPFRTVDGLLKSLRAARSAGHALVDGPGVETTVAVAVGAPAPYAGVAVAGDIPPARVPGIVAALRAAAADVAGAPASNTTNLSKEPS